MEKEEGQRGEEGAKRGMLEAALVKGAAYFEYEDYEIAVNDDMDKYEIVGKMGRGKYSDVYRALRVGQDEKWSVLKILKPVRMAKVRREIKILKSLEHPSIVSLESVMFDPCCRTYCLAFDLVDSGSGDYLNLAEKEVREFLRQLLEGLHYCHSRGIIHRDIKPQNVLMDRKARRLKIIDWGLADYYLPKKEFNVRVASRYYKPPQLLLNNHYYDYSLDIWSAGCLFASMMFKKAVFFKGMDNVDQLFKIGEILGTESIRNYVKKYGLKPDPAIREWLSNEDFPAQSFLHFQTKDNLQMASDSAIDLLSQMLRVDHHRRITALEALSHPYFHPS